MTREKPRRRARAQERTGDKPDGRAKPARSWMRWSGLALILTGLVLLGYVAWQFWGTNWVSERAQKRIVDEVERTWADEPASQNTSEDPVEVPEGNVSALIRIPRFGDDYVIPVLQGTSDGVLAAGYGHFSDSQQPGKRGNYALAAHRVTHGEPLRDMPELQPGDKVIIETRRMIHTYRLTTGGDDLVVPFTETWVLDRLPTNPDAGEPQPDQKQGQRLITLTTCSELFHTDDRMIAFGVLEKSQPRG